MKQVVLSLEGGGGGILKFSRDMEIVICDYSMALETFACGESLAGAKAVPTSKIFLNIQNTCSKSDLSNTGLKVKILANIVIDKSV